MKAINIYYDINKIAYMRVENFLLKEVSPAFSEYYRITPSMFLPSIFITLDNKEEIKNYFECNNLNIVINAIPTTLLKEFCRKDEEIYKNVLTMMKEIEQNAEEVYNFIVVDKLTAINAKKRLALIKSKDCDIVGYPLEINQPYKLNNFFSIVMNKGQEIHPNKYKVLAIIGESASGKDTLIDKLKSTKGNGNFYFPVKYTTRPRRPNEKKNAYNFTNLFEMQKIPNKICRESFNGWEYFFTEDSFDRDKINIVIIPPCKIYEFLTNPNFRTKFLRILTSPRNRYQRSIKRDPQNSAEIMRRLLADARDFNRIDEYFDFDIRINNNYEDNTMYSIDWVVKAINRQF